MKKSVKLASSDSSRNVVTIGLKKAKRQTKTGGKTEKSEEK